MIVGLAAGVVEPKIVTILADVFLEIFAIAARIYACIRHKIDARASRVELHRHRLRWIAEPQFTNILLILDVF